jgi:hypothetical protein
MQFEETEHNKYQGIKSFQFMEVSAIKLLIVLEFLYAPVVLAGSTNVYILYYVVCSNIMRLSYKIVNDML